MELCVVAAIFAGISIFSALRQPIEPPLGDAAEYGWMARQFRDGRGVVNATGPYVYRIATPWLASFGTKAQVESGDAFFWVNVPAAAIIAVLFHFWLRRFVTSAAVRVLLVTMFLFEWHGPARWVYFYPVYVDPLFIVFVLTGLLVIDASRTRPPSHGALPLAVVVFLGTLVRETTVLIALAFIAAHNPLTRGRHHRQWRDGLWTLLPLLAAIGALVVTRVVGRPYDHAPYSPLTEPLQMLRDKPVFTWVLAWFFAFGPATIAIIASGWRGAVDWLRGRPDLAFYLAACAVLGFLGGKDTERILLWAAPVVYVMAGRAMEEQRRAFRSVALVLVLVTVQVVSERVFWPVPSGQYPEDVTALSNLASRTDQVYALLNRLVVVDTYYNNLWSYFGSRPLHAAVLIYDIAFVIVAAVWIRSRGRERPAGVRSSP